jgi:hypothetical protein
MAELDPSTAPVAVAPAPAASLPARAVIALVRLYQVTLSPWLGRQCRFTPTCSRYMIEAVARYGAFRGGMMGARRICRCNPWGGAGHDPVP